MARINIDDELHAEKGFKRLVRELKDEDKAVGLLYRFWRAAQDYWGDEKALMPGEEFESDGFGPILEVGLAIRKEHGIYACGAEERFAWYLQRCRANRAKITEREAPLIELERLRAEVAALKAVLATRAADSGARGPAPDVRNGISGTPETDSRNSEGDAPDARTRAAGAPPVPVTATVTASVAVPASASDRGNATRDAVENSEVGVDNSARSSGKPANPAVDNFEASSGQRQQPRAGPARGDEAELLILDQKIKQHVKEKGPEGEWAGRS